jgi:hypothetical protein
MYLPTSLNTRFGRVFEKKNCWSKEGDVAVGFERGTKKRSDVRKCENVQVLGLLQGNNKF